MLEMKGNDNPPLRRFQVVGERSSGTNFVSALIRRNIVLEPGQDFGWKHGFPRLLAPRGDLLLIAVFRDPRDWVRSMFARPWHTTAAIQALDFSAFLRAAWDTRVDRPDYFDLPAHAPELDQPLLPDRDPLTLKPFANLLRMRQAKASALIGLHDASPRMVLAGFETILEDPEGFLGRLARTYGLARKGAYRPISRRLGQRFRAILADRPEPPSALTERDLAHLRAESDARIEARLGYAL